MTASTRKPLALLGAAALALSFAASPAVAATLTGAQFMETHVGKCISYKGESVGVQCFHADGTMDYDDKTYGKDTGNWSVDGDKICQEWSAEPGVTCTAFKVDGSGVYSDGGYTWTIE